MWLRLRRRSTLIVGLGWEALYTHPPPDLHTKTFCPNLIKDTRPPTLALSVAFRRKSRVVNVIDVLDW